MAYIFKNLNKSYGEQVLLDDFTITLPEMGIVSLMGASGSGKTTLVHMLADIMKGQVAVVFQEDRLLPWRSISENIDIVMKDWKKDKHKSQEWLKKFGLDDIGEKAIDELSGGMKRRIAIARAMAYDKPIVIMDEPFAGLDEETRDKVAKEIFAINGKLYLIVTHNKEEALAYSDKIIYMAGAPLKIVKEENRNADFY